MQQDDDGRHSESGYVYLAFTVDEIWQGVDAAEAAGISLKQIGRALNYEGYESIIVAALAYGDTALLRTLIGEAQP
jgi:hypothetical protein